jgi:PAS domain S-box-containing protein
VKTTPALPEWCWKSYLGHGLLDANGVWVCLNPALCNLFQRPAGEFLGRRLDEFLAEPSREVFRKAWEDMASGAHPSRCMDLEFPARNVRRLFTDVFLTTFDEVPGTMMLQILNITRHKETEKELAQAQETQERNEASLRMILDNLPIPVITSRTTGDGEITLINKEFTRLLGYTLEDMPSAMAWAAKAYPEEEYRKMVVDWWRDTLANAANIKKPIENVEFFVMGKDGVTRDILFHTTLVGGLIVIAMQDVTAQKKAAAELEAAYRVESTLRSEAERIALARSRFLAGVSHEIRTPISALVNLSQSLLMESEKYVLPEEFVEHLEKVRAGGQYLNLILTNLLDLSAAGSGHTPVRPQNFYLRDWVEDIGALIEAIARGRSTEIIWSLPEDENEKFSTDAVRLSQILLNLAQNAVKFSTKPNARIWISISKKGSSLELSVADEGPGIPPGKLDELFKEFGQSDTNTNIMDRGVGLGLAVVRQNVSLLGGGISTRPVEPSGICFEITVPELHKQPVP